MRLFPAILMTLAAGVAQAQWQADVSTGENDPIGILVFFFGFAAWVHIKAGFKESRAKGYRAIAISVAVAIGAYLFQPVRMLLALIFLVSLVHFAWTTLRGR